MMLVDCSKEWGLLEAQGSKYIFNRAKYILSFHFCMVLNCRLLISERRNKKLFRIYSVQEK